MGPVGHLFVGYVLYSALVRLRGHTPGDYATVALLVGTQFPDLVDKPLAWTLDVLPNGRSLAHSLFTAVVLVVALYLLLDRHGRSTLANAFGVGYLSHLVGDALASAAVGQYTYYYVGFLAWPLVPAIDEGEKSLLAELPSVGAATFSTVEVGIVALVVGLWVLDGTPGLRPVLAAPRRMYRWLAVDR